MNRNIPKSAINILSLIRPRYIIAITIGIALLMFVSAWLELRQSREELLHVLHEHSLSLAETIEQSSANIVLSAEYIEDQLSERLFNNAYFIARLDSAQKLTNRDLQIFAEANNIFRINIFNARGRKILTNIQPQGFAYGLQSSHTPNMMIAPILRNETERLVIGFRQARFQEGDRFAVAVRRTHKDLGAIVLNLDAAEILEFRRNIGIGRLVKDLSNNSGIEYVVLQDSMGIIAATNNIKKMSRIDDDYLLQSVLNKDSVVTRQISIGDRDVFEVVRSLAIDGSIVGILRIGLSMDEIRSVENRMWRRMLIMSLVLIAIGVIVMMTIVANQNYHMLSQKYERARVFTENILHQMQDIVITVDDQQRVTIFNQRAEEFFGIHANAVLGKSLDELPEGLHQSIRTLYMTGSAQSEQKIILPGENEFVVSVSVTNTQKSDGTMESQTLVIKDLTEANRLEREIQRKEKLTAIGELASGVAHEIRNPLNAISMIAQRYEKEFSPKKNAEEYNELTKVLKKESARVNNIIQQFLLFTRPAKIQRMNVDAEDLLQHISILFSPLAHKKKIDFRSSADDIVLNIDEDQMTQALLNLLQNSLDAVQKDGSIEFTIKKTTRGVDMRVVDTGSGIPIENKEKIFNLYFTTKSGGTGLGLGITHQIISQHGGTIEVNSENGKGSTFTIRIPQA